MPTVVVLMAVSLGSGFLERELPAGSVRVEPDPDVKRHRDQALAAAVERALADGGDVVVDVSHSAGRRAVIRAAAAHGARVVGYWARPPDFGRPGNFDLEPERGQLSRKPRRGDGFDVLYEVIEPDGDYRLREL